MAAEPNQRRHRSTNTLLYSDSNTTMNHHDDEKHRALSTNSKNKKIGIFLIIAPFAGLVGILVLFAVTSFVLSSMAADSSTVATNTTQALNGVRTAGRIINVLLSSLGIIFVAWIFIGVPIGILYLRKKAIDDGTTYDERSGIGGASIVSDEVKGWNWGAFGLPVIWGLYYSVWISLLCLIPLVSIPVRIYLGIKGNELAWKKNKWISVNDLHKAQRKWRVWGIIAFIISLLLTSAQLSAIGDGIDTSDTSTSSSAHENISNQPTPVTISTIDATPNQNPLDDETEFDLQIMNANLKRKCQAEAYNTFSRNRLPGYVWQAHWNSELRICLLEMTGWDTEIVGVWNMILWDVAGEEGYGSLSIHNPSVAAGVQSKSEDPAKNGALSTCVMKNEVGCESIEEWYRYRNSLMQQ